MCDKNKRKLKLKQDPKLKTAVPTSAAKLKLSQNVEQFRLFRHMLSDQRTLTTSTSQVTANSHVLLRYESPTVNNTHILTSIFPGKPGLAGCPLDSPSPVILILSVLTEQAKTLHPFFLQ